MNAALSRVLGNRFAPILSDHGSAIIRYEFLDPMNDERVERERVCEFISKPLDRVAALIVGQVTGGRAGAVEGTRIRGECCDSVRDESSSRVFIG